MRQTSLVAYYGSKPSELQDIILNCQSIIQAALGPGFIAYELRQIHATIISLERLEPKYNLNFSRYRGQNLMMDFDLLLQFLRVGGTFPFVIQLGGYKKRQYPFLSQGQTPYKRSFAIQDDKVVLMGWPIQGYPIDKSFLSQEEAILECGVYNYKLEDVRKSCQTFNVLHSYHRKISDVDNDFYFRIGLIDKAITETKIIDELEIEVREYLSTAKPLLLEVARKDIYFASYEDNRLPTTTTKVWPLMDELITPEYLWGLYE